MPADLDALIVGGGPAGASAACRLASAGARVALFEREAGPRPRVCGEFLSPSACAELGGLGLDLPSLGAAAIERIRMIGGRSHAAAASPFSARGLSREILDEALLALARRTGTAIRRGSAVRSLRRVCDRWRVVTGDGATAEAPAVVLATGKHDLREHRRTTTARAGPIGLKMHWRLRHEQTLALAGQIELVWFEGGYAGLQAVEGGLANLCLVLRSGSYRSVGRSWDCLLARLRHLAPHLDRRLRGAEPMALDPAAIAGMPYGYVHAERDELPGLYRVGDQFAVIASFTGEGMAIALRTGRLAAAALAAGSPASAYHASARAQLGPAVQRARRLASLAAHPVAQALLVQSCRVQPALLRVLAQCTRIPNATAG